MILPFTEGNLRFSEIKDKETRERLNDILLTIVTPSSGECFSGWIKVLLTDGSPNGHLVIEAK